MGDALGWPAMYHRAIHLGSRRTCLWPESAAADREQILRFPLPFSVDDGPDLPLRGTDDTEMAALSARALLDLPHSPAAAAVLVAYDHWLFDVGEEIWSGISERAAILNRRNGLAPLQTGDRNPAREDDGAVARAIPVGILAHRDDDEAARIAGLVAETTNAGDGVLGAVVMARAIAAAVRTGSLDTAYTSAVAAIPDDSWTGRSLARAVRLLERAGTAWAALPDWIDEIANRSYSYGTIAAETVPLALLLTRATGADLATAIPLAATVAKQADSMPAMVGALCGAVQGAAAVPARWHNRLDRVQGGIVPAVRGESLVDLADRLVERAT